MKSFIFLFCCLLGASGVHSQMIIEDEHITNQQERMVFKSWDKSKFTPKPGFLALNPLYWLTWGLHPNYPGTDLRPLGPKGPQSGRLALAVLLSAAEQQLKLQSDSVRQTALANLAQHSGLLSDFDPLWNLYYSSVLSPLTAFPKDLFSGLKENELSSLKRLGLIDWYLNEHQQLRERLFLARTSDLERGARILYYHRLLIEYRKLKASWEDKKRITRPMLAAKVQRERLLSREKFMDKWTLRDIEIADRVLKNSRL